MTRDQLHAALAALDDEDLFVTLAPFAARRDLVGPFGARSFRDWEKALAWIAFKRYAATAPTPDAISQAIEDHDSVAWTVLETMSRDSDYYRRIKTLANKIESAGFTGAFLRRDKS